MALTTRIAVATIAPAPEVMFAIPAAWRSRRVAAIVTSMSGQTIEVINTVAIHLLSATAVKLGLGEEAEPEVDLDEARKLITALAGFVTAAAPEIGSQHAGPLRDGLRTLQLAFREASTYPDKPGQGPGEKFTGPVFS